MTVRECKLELDILAIQVRRIEGIDTVTVRIDATGPTMTVRHNNAKQIRESRLKVWDLVAITFGRRSVSQRTTNIIPLETFIRITPEG